MSKQKTVIKSTDNLFKKLGFDDAEAENLRIRAVLMTAIKRYIADHKVTQSEAATLFDVAQPRISEINQGKIELFTVDKLINMLSRVHYQVDITVRDNAA